ncbi:MAG: putative DNA-binding domain-containing protein [Oleispira antarctica]|nr:putative DNA-binding domain-containing protein [Oleispira antarctica]MBQ0791576.1 putative DNA-binding domain-containing protein [Oleispira antarctica]
MHEQNKLVRAIFKADSTADHAADIDIRGLKVYQRNLKVNATNALKITFPTVLTLIGDEVFSYAVEQLLQQDPPSAGDWGLWGKNISSVLKNLNALQEFPYVADMATLDFLLHQSAREKDNALSMDSLSLLASCELDELRVVLNPAFVLLTSGFPIVDIYRANEASSDQCEYYLQQAQQKLLSGVGQVALIYRPQFKPLVRTLESSEHDWLRLMQQNFSIGKALDVLMHRKQEFSLEAWLPLAIEQNLISHLEKIES